MSTSEEYLLVEKRLAEVGIVCSDPYLLAKDTETLNRAAPLFMELLAEVKSLGVKSALIRVASDGPVPPGQFIAELKSLRPLIEAGNRQIAALAWDLGEAIHKTADNAAYKEILEILRDKRFGKARQMLPYALVKVAPDRDEMIQIFLEVLTDEDITAHTLGALAKIKAVEAIPAVRKYLDSAVPLFRRSATKALKKLEKAAGKDQSSTTAPPIERCFEVGPAEASTSFDAEQVRPFLNLLVPLLEGFGQPEIDLIESRLLEMEVDEEVSFNFQIRYAGTETSLQIAIFMDDVDTPDIAFYTSVELATVIDKLFEDELM